MGNIHGAGCFEMSRQQGGRRLIVITQFFHNAGSRGRDPDTLRIHDPTFKQ